MSSTVVSGLTMANRVQTWPWCLVGVTKATWSLRSLADQAA